MSVETKKKFTFSDGILLLALTLVGGFHEYISCLLAAVMSVYLAVRLHKSKQLRVKKSLLAVTVGVICLGYGITCFWAVDNGMALMGFFKFLPLGLYMLCLWQEDKQDCALDVLPYFGAAMAVLSAVGMQWQQFEDLFAVSGRLSGFFQYPNTFAIFLLVCELLLLKKEHKKLWDYAVLLVLVAGFLYTGSRTAFIIFLAANGLMLLALSNKKTRLILIGLAGAACLAVVVLALSGNSIIRRYLNISLTESTFVGRILYVVDALPLLLKYPFGMGYMGYYYIQDSIRTGVYSVVYLHNDFMQLFLDIGLIPGVLFLAAVGRWFFRKTIPLTDKIIVGAVCLHSLFDFDLQFVGVFMVLLLLLDSREEGTMLTLKAGALKPVLGVTALAGAYLCVALGTAHLGLYELGETLYPYNTRNKLTLLEQEEDIEKANALADAILAQNTDCYVPYTIKATYSYSQGDFGSMIGYMNTVFEKNPFGRTEYNTYCQMLINGIALYEAAGDTASADVCRSELLSAQQKLAANADRLSKLGSMIDDQPLTYLSSEIREYIEQMGE